MIFLNYTKDNDIFLLYKNYQAYFCLIHFFCLSLHFSPTSLMCRYMEIINKKQEYNGIQL